MRSLEQPGNLRPNLQREFESIWRELRKLQVKQGRADQGRKFDMSFSLAGPIYVSESGPWYPPNFGGRLVGIVAGLKVAGSTDTVVKVQVNEADVPGGSITIPAGQKKVLHQSVDEFLSGDSDFITVGVTSAGTGAVSLTVQTRWILA